MVPGRDAVNDKACDHQNASHLRGGSRYGPTPAAPDGAADRQAPAPEACKETDRWRPTDDPGDHPRGLAANRSRRAHRPAGTRAVTLAGLPEVLTVREAAKVLRVGRNQLYQAVASGQLHALRIGRSIRIPKQALLDLLAHDSPSRWAAMMASRGNIRRKCVKGHRLAEASARAGASAGTPASSCPTAPTASAAWSLSAATPPATRPRPQQRSRPGAAPAHHQPVPGPLAGPHPHHPPRPHGRPLPQPAGPPRAPLHRRPAPGQAGAAAGAGRLRRARLGRAEGRQAGRAGPPAHPGRPPLPAPGAGAGGHLAAPLRQPRQTRDPASGSREGRHRAAARAGRPAAGRRHRRPQAVAAGLDGPGGRHRRPQRRAVRPGMVRS